MSTRISGVAVSTEEGPARRRPPPACRSRRCCSRPARRPRASWSRRRWSEREAAQSTLNAFRVICAEEALAAADEADRRLGAGDDAPLLGVPVAIKDDVDLAGHTTPFGCGGGDARRARCRGGAAPARGGRDRDRQDPRARGRPVALHRDAAARRHPQPLEHRPHPGRLQRRGRRGRRRGHGPGGDRLRRRRLGPHPRRLDRPGRAEAAARAHLDLARPRGLQRAQLLRPADPQRRRRGPAARRDPRQRPRRPAPARKPPSEPFAEAAAREPGRLRIALSFAIPFGVPAKVDRRASRGDRIASPSASASSATRSSAPTPTTAWSARP